MAAYFVASGIGVWKWQKAGDVIIVPSDGLSVKTFPSITIESHTSTHDPQVTMNELFHTDIVCKFGVTASQGPGVVNPYSVRVARDALIGQVMAAMSQSDDGATLGATSASITQYGRALATTGTAQEQENNADMAEFTCLATYYEGSARGKPSEPGCAWIEIRHFRIECCPTAIN